MAAGVYKFCNLMALLGNIDDEWGNTNVFVLYTYIVKSTTRLITPLPEN